MSKLFIMMVLGAVVGAMTGVFACAGLLRLMGNLTLRVDRGGGFYPDIVEGGVVSVMLLIFAASG